MMKTDVYKKSIEILRKFVAETPKEEMEKIVKEFKNLGIDGPTWEEYLISFSSPNETQSEKSARLFDKFLTVTPKEEIEKILDEFNGVIGEGPTVLEYFNNFGSNQKVNMNTQDELVSFKTAKLAKEKGFNIECNNFFNEGSGYKSQTDSLLRTGKDKIIEQPTQTLLRRWLREEKGIDLWDGLCNKPNRYQIEDIIRIEDDFRLGGIMHGSPTYEEALEQGLYLALILL